jgi:hypothetical protein
MKPSSAPTLIRAKATERIERGDLIVRDEQDRFVPWTRERREHYGSFGVFRLPNGMLVEIPTLRCAGFAVRAANPGEDFEFFEPPSAEIMNSNPLGEKVRYRLGVLAEDVTDDETVPTAEARNRCIRLLGDVAQCMPDGPRLPFPRISTAGGGDIECTWEHGVRTLLLSIAPSGAARLQKIRSGAPDAENLAVVDAPSVEALLTSILWVTGSVVTIPHRPGI